VSDLTEGPAMRRIAVSFCWGLFLSSTYAVGIAAADDLTADTKAGLKLLAEGDAKADKGETNDAVLLYKQAFEQILPGMRKIRFKHEVKRDVTAREQLREVIRKEIENDKSPTEFHGDEIAMKALGLIPRSLDLKETLLAIYSEEIAAFYDPKTKTMHLIKEPEEKTKKAPSLLERLMGRKGGFDKDENKTVIAHELTHALADQNYDLDALSNQIKGDDDRDLALSSLVEGEATLAMFAAGNKDWDGSVMAKTPAAGLERMLNFMGPLMVSTAGGKAMRNAPEVFGELMIFPYFRGMVFCARLTNDSGWEALDAAYKSPPLSTEQILHPEKYRARPDVPMAIDLGRLDVPEGWKEATRNVAGEFQIGILLQKYQGKAAAAGWDGDGFAAFEGPDDRLGLAWLSTWDTEDDAKEFARSYCRFQTRKLDEGTKEPDTVPEIFGRTHKTTGAVYYIECRGMDVAVVEGLPREATLKLADRLFQCKKTEKRAFPTPNTESPASVK
jgi:hypothetical protein